ncbi:unnamed protein product [Musa acuminata subsp. burmannicoides]
MMMYLKRYAYDIAMGSQFPPKSPLLESTNRGQKQRSEIEADPEEERKRDRIDRGVTCRVCVERGVNASASLSRNRNPPHKKPIDGSSSNFDSPIHNLPSHVSRHHSRLLIRVPFTDGGSLRFSSHAINGMAYGDNKAWKGRDEILHHFGNPICIYLDRNCPNLQSPSPILVPVTSDWVRS